MDRGGRSESTELSDLVDFDHLYVEVRRAYAEALSEATTDAEQGLWRSRSLQLRRFREMLDVTDAAALAQASAELTSRKSQLAEHIAHQIGSSHR